MKLTTTIILVLLLAITGVVFIYQARQPAASSGPTTNSSTRNRGGGKPVFGDQPIKADNIQTVTITREDRSVTLGRDDAGQWVQTKPVHFGLSQGSVSRVIKAAANLRFVNRFGPGKADKPTLGELQLKPPGTLITLTTKSGEKHTIHLSDQTAGGNSYALIDGKKSVFVVDDKLQNRLSQSSINDWRQKTLSAPSAAKADQLTIKRAGQTVRADKLDGRWFLTRDKTQRASADAVSGLIGAVNAVRIEEFVADQQADMSLYGLDDPQVITKIRTPAVKDRPGRTRRLEIGGPADLSNDSYYATWSTTRQRSSKPAAEDNSASASKATANAGDGPSEDEAKPGGPNAKTPQQASRSSVVFTIEASAIKPFKVTTADLRDSRICSIDRSEVNGLKIDRPSKPTVHLQRQGMKFAFADPGPGYDADATAADSLLGSILSANARSYHAGFSPEAEPTATITLSQRGGGSRKIRLFPGPTHADQSKSKSTGTGMGTGTGKRKADDAGKANANEAGKANSDDADAEKHETSADGSEKDARKAQSTRTYITLTDDETVGYEVPAETLKPVFEPLIALRDRDLLVPGVEAIQKLVVNRPDGTYIFTRGRPKSSSGAQTNSDETPQNQTDRGNANASGDGHGEANDNASASASANDNDNDNGDGHGDASGDGERNTHVEADNGQATQRGESSTWLMNGSSDFEKSAWQTLHHALQPLRAKRWLDNAANVEPAANWLKLQVSLAKKKPFSLRVDPKTRHAVVNGIDQPLVLRKKTLKALQAEFHDRDVLSFNSDQIRSVTITQPGKSKASKTSKASNAGNSASAIRINRDSQGRYHLEGGQGNEGRAVSEPRAAGIFDTLAGLRAKRFHGTDQLDHKPKAADYRFKIETTTPSDQTHTLEVYSAKQSPFDHPLAHLDQAKRYFEIARTDYGKLTANPTQSKSN